MGVCVRVCVPLKINAVPPQKSNHSFLVQGVLVHSQILAKKFTEKLIHSFSDPAYKRTSGQNEQIMVITT